MGTVRITWQRTCEYVADIDTAELRELVSRLPGHERNAGLVVIGELEAGNSTLAQELGWLLSSTEIGREYLRALGAFREHIASLGTPEVTEVKAAPAGKRTERSKP
jgi:hypothetical protein